MAPPRIGYSLLLLVVTAVVGCRCPACKCVPATPAAPCVYPSIERTERTPDLAAVTPVVEPSPSDFPCRLPGEGDAYDQIDPSTCQCNAATNAVVANAVRIERHWADVLIACEEGAAEESLCLTRSLLKLKAENIRNSSAASALTTLYLLAGCEAQIEHVDRGASELQTTLDRLQRLRENRLPVPEAIDRDALAVRRVDLADKRLQLCALRVQLNGQLKRLLGCPLDSSRLFWPDIDWAPNLAPVDVESAVAYGLANRSDVRSLRLVRCRLDKATVPIARQVLQVADATLGAVSPTPGWVHNLRCGDCKDHEIAVRCRQLTLIGADNQKQAEAEIKSAAYKVGAQQERVRLARRAVGSRRDELRDLERRREAEGLSIFEISAARGRVFDAESSLVEKVIELKVAEVGLREAQGRLAIECGYHARVCCEGRCTGCCSWGGCGCRPLPPCEPAPCEPAPCGAAGDCCLQTAGEVAVD